MKFVILEKAKTYQEKLDEISEAIEDDKQIFYINTRLGNLEVKGINKKGTVAYTGDGFSKNSWDISKKEILNWFNEIRKKPAWG